MGKTYKTLRIVILGCGMFCFACNASSDGTEQRTAKDRLEYCQYLTCCSYAHSCLQHRNNLPNESTHKRCNSNVHLGNRLPQGMTCGAPACTVKLSRINWRPFNAPGLPDGN